MKELTLYCVEVLFESLQNRLRTILVEETVTGCVGKCLDWVHPCFEVFRALFGDVRVVDEAVERGGALKNRTVSGRQRHQFTSILSRSNSSLELACDKKTRNTSTDKLQPKSIFPHQNQNNCTRQIRHFSFYTGGQIDQLFSVWLMIRNRLCTWEMNWVMMAARECVSRREAVRQTG